MNLGRTEDKGTQFFIKDKKLSIIQGIFPCFYYAELIVPQKIMKPVSMHIQPIIVFSVTNFVSLKTLFQEVDQENVQNNLNG